jgi:hypothetical protein
MLHVCVICVACTLVSELVIVLFNALIIKEHNTVQQNYTTTTITELGSLRPYSVDS